MTKHIAVPEELMEELYGYCDSRRVLDGTDLRDKVRALLDGPGVEPVASDHRERLGRRVREVWIAWAKEQANPKPSWLVEWSDLSEPDKEVDRRIGCALWCDCIAEHADDIAAGILALNNIAAPVPSDDQGPFDKSRLKRLVTQVFGEGWQIVAPVQAVPDGWKEAAIAWEVCASIHRQWAKGKDALFSTRQADFVRHADEARAMLAIAPQQPATTDKENGE